MIGRTVVLCLPDDEPVQFDHKTLFKTGDTGLVVGRHPRWDAWLVVIHGKTAVFFPDEICDAT